MNQKPSVDQTLKSVPQVLTSDNPETGSIEFAQLEDPSVDDLLDDLSEHTLKTGGEVVIVPQDRMPTDTGIAAIYRF